MDRPKANATVANTGKIRGGFGRAKFWSADMGEAYYWGQAPYTQKPLHAEHILDARLRIWLAIRFRLGYDALMAWLILHCKIADVLRIPGDFREEAHREKIIKGISRNREKSTY